MKRAFLHAVFLAGLAMSTAPAAHAATLVNSQYCGGNEFSTCAFIQSSSTTSGGVTVLTLTVSNPTSNTAGGIFTDIGIANLPAGAKITSTSTSDASFSFKAKGPNGLSGAGIYSDVVGFEAKNPQPKTGLEQGTSATFTFTFGGVVDLSSIQYAIHAQAADNRCGGSTKLVLGSSNGGYQANVPGCGVVVPPVTTVPEPASMTLLATGLAGIGGIVRRRGRKQGASTV